MGMNNRTSFRSNDMRKTTSPPVLGRASRTVALVLVFVSVSAASGELPRWEFESDSDLHQWAPNSHLSNVAIKDGILRADATDWDPFFLCRNVTIAAKPYQYVAIRLKADRPGIAELFWSGELEGQYGGLTEKKKVRFSVKGEDLWQEIVIFPFPQQPVRTD